jgi:2-methylcitrate dehydratase PrpD
MNPELWAARWQRGWVCVLYPKAPMEGKFSQPFCTAVSLVEGGAIDRSFTMDHITNPIIVDLVGKTTVQVVPEMNTTEAEVEIVIQNQRTFRKRIDTEKLNFPESRVQQGLTDQLQRMFQRNNY